MEDGVAHKKVSGGLYGEGKSLVIWARGWQKHDSAQPISREVLVCSDLTDWRYRPLPGQVAVDPELGRIAFAPGDVPKRVFVSYQYGLSADIGGGEYIRTLSSAAGSQVYRVSAEGKEEHNDIRKALHRWKEDNFTCAVIEITDSHIYDEENLHIELEENQTLQLRAAQGTRPIIRLLDRDAGRADHCSVTGQRHSRLTIDGLLIAGRGIQVSGELQEIVIRHSTLVPGWVPRDETKRRRGAEASVSLMKTAANLVIENSIVGGIEMTRSDQLHDPSAICIRDSIVDATGPQQESVWSDTSMVAYVTLTVQRATMLGAVKVHALDLAENSIFMGCVTVGRRQKGCVRFCYVPPASRTPRQYECQPDLAQRNVGQTEKATTEIAVAPIFASTRYGEPTYCQLDDSCPIEIKRGADDRSEMGVFHDLFQPQREANLRARLDEYAPADADVGVLYLN